MNINIAEILILVIINALSIFLIIVVLANSFKDRTYRWFVLMTIFLLGWVDFAYLGYWQIDTSLSVFSYRLNGAFVAAFFFAIYVFYVECFLRINKKYFKFFLLLISFGFVCLSLFTDTIVSSVIHREWGNEIIFGQLNNLFNLFTVSVTFILLYFFVSRYFTLPINEKRKVKFFLFGIFFLIVFNVVFNVLSPQLLNTARYQHFGDYSAIIFLGFTAYAMLTKKFLNVKVALTAFLVTVIGMLLVVDIVVLSNNLFEQTVKIVMLIFFIGISITLVRSVLAEVKQREELDKVNKALEKATAVLTTDLTNTKSLYNLTANVSKTLDPNQVAQSAVDSLPQDDSMVGSVLGRYDEQKREIRVIATSKSQLSYQVQKVIGDFGQYAISIDDIRYQNNTSNIVFKNETPVFTNNLEEYLTPPVPSQFIPIVKKILNIKSVAVYPVISRGKTIGIIAFLMKQKTAEELDESEKQLLTTYSNQIGIALDNASLYKMSQDIQKRLETALIQLEESRKHERDMIDIMGHELRTPISIVRNALVMADKKVKGDSTQASPEIQKWIEMAVDSTRREVALIETLLSATKTDGKGFQLMLEQINLVDVIQNSLNAFQKDAVKKGLTINYTPPTEPVYIYADKTRTQEISDNFMSNAVKYTLKGSIDIHINKDAEYGYISIKDSGIGITESDLKRLGEKFFRARQYIDDQIAAHPELKEKIEVVRPGGTGLGLFVTFNLIKIMDGKLDVQSKVGEGSTFTFALPLYTNQQSQQVEKKLERD